MVYQPLVTTGWRRALRGVALLAFGFLYLPVVMLVLFSFSDSRLLVFPIESFSFRWYGVLFADHDLQRSILNSFLVAGTVVPVTLLLGTPLAFALDRFRFPGKVVLEQGLLIPLIVPGLITGLAILLVLKEMDVRLSLATVIVGHSVWCLPIVVTQVFARLRRFDRRIEEASMDLGATRAQTFLRVTLPNIRTALVASALLTFTLSFDEVPVTFFLTGTQNTLPMHIWSMLREGVTPEINAIATITVAVSIVILIVALRLISKSNEARAAIVTQPGGN
jgi:spermidine/putrescine transport system permease protein